MGLISELRDGKKREITAEDFDYFLGVLPPVAYRFTWGGESWNFGFCEGLDYLVGFKQEGDRYFARQTDILNPEECGVSIEDQARGKADWMKRRLNEVRLSDWGRTT
jgi:hypothetical protein